MNYVELKMDADTSYKLFLTSQQTVELERKLGRNPVAIFVGGNGQAALPLLEDVITVLFFALKKHHNISKYAVVYEIYDHWIAAGNSLTELIPIIVKVFQVSGLLPRDMKELEQSEKNEHMTDVDL